MLPKLNIVADAHIWGVESAFSRLAGYDVDLQTLEHTSINREALNNTDVLLTRSSTMVNSELLADTPVRFAATATIGDDHYDKDWLDANGIAWANAAGSSTGSVVEYMIATLLELHVQGRISIPDSCIGIIGVGRIGGMFADICQAIGMDVLKNDPPRQRKEGENGFCALDELLAKADILTLHAPLITDGVDCTVRLLNARRLSDFQGKGIINAGRGGCIDNADLCDWLDTNADHFAALDCWENEPAPSTRLLQHPQLVIATPHIAGHSIDGKAANTQFAYRALCQHLHIRPTWDMANHLPGAGRPVDLETGSDAWLNLHAAIKQLYPLDIDHKAMKSWAYLKDPELSNAFIQYRRYYPVRRAWRHAPVHFKHTNDATVQLAQAMGVTIA
jgi:erythronate-4-phosphate dehydrogenase